ncbi:cobyric acid synthase CobQ [Acidisphaera rubrifaciens HS-AP3]|uniref:Cobyric acid synthase n=1 Tax=Acidisphaera rubrifaciens HS-AP3 TaxID=1231350 RepID=A0A0D6P4Y1_9PROT|nr:cobyric acid synthase CobQ [Acidisphaera rubrifaciens HS-AP3]
MAGLARALHRRGLAVRPFKPQNMSNNAAVTADGGEIGRAQALQARAAGVAPSVHMNPVLLKPQSEVGAQLVVQGRVRRNADARAYQTIKRALLPVVLDSFATIGRDADIVLVEGAGSASEINLRPNDIANMGFARAADVPVVIIGDIDRGGVIASVVGTWAVLEPGDAALVRGYVINRMRGDATLFNDGLTAITRHTGWPSFGLVPHFAPAALLPAEDAADLTPSAGRRGAGLRVAVPLLPHIANFDDLDPLAAEPDVALARVPRGHPLPLCDVVILPGSKATRADLAVLREEGWDIDLRAHHRRGGAILGICGGLQMLGRTIDDPTGVEGAPGCSEGLGLLDVTTCLTGQKVLAITGVGGYEMHVGRTEGADWHDGHAVSSCGRVRGTYRHGLFNDDAARRDWLACLGASPSDASHEARIDATLDALAVHLEAHIDVDRLLTIAR